MDTRRAAGSPAESQDGLRTVMLFPVRKYVAIFGAVRGVPNDIMSIVLLGRTVHRASSRAGWNGDGKSLRADAVAVRRGVRGSGENQDLRLLRGALGDGLSQGRSLTRAAVAYARELFGKDERARAPARRRVERGAEKIEAVLRRPDIVEELEKFDGRVDEKLAARTHR